MKKAPLKMNIDDNALFGLNQDHLNALGDGHFVNSQAQKNLTGLTQAAQAAGFSLKLASSFRPFERQLAIFNGKFNGIRPILDLNADEVDISTMDDWQKCQAILLYSALPGSSRHHWGTDFDFYDGKTLPNGYQLQLIEQEYTGNGPFTPLAQWLITHAGVHGFYFPYQQFNGGVASEPWHISYYPLASQYLAQLTVKRLSVLIEHSQICAKATILANMDEIFSRYVNNINDLT
ncbi:MAG: LAS superfamily LD-carboxypeptidase LdcB [Alteromonadaceae bacterium]|jgi:LAS superfamily LD-carboxypeptidase LdcB